jgi:hypothetical protein
LNYLKLFQNPKVILNWNESLYFFRRKLCICGIYGLLSAIPNYQIATFATFAEGPQNKIFLQICGFAELVYGPPTFGKILKTVIFPAGHCW